MGPVRVCVQCDSWLCRCRILRVQEKTEEDAEFWRDAVSRGLCTPEEAEHAMKPLHVLAPPTDKLTDEQFAEEFAKFLDES